MSYLLLKRQRTLTYYRADFELSHLRPYEPWRCIARIVGKLEYTIMGWEIRKPSIVRGVVQDQRWSIHTVDSAERWTLKKTAIVMSTVEIMEIMEISAASVWFSNAPLSIWHPLTRTHSLSLQCQHHQPEIYLPRRQ